MTHIGSVYFVEEGTYGAHEHNAVFSVWLYEAEAVTERDRLIAAYYEQFSDTGNKPDFQVREVPVNEPHDSGINWA